MAFEGRRKTLPSSRWGAVLDVLEEMHWTYDAYLETPQELVTELEIRIYARREAEHKAAKRQEQEARQARTRR